MSDTTDSLNTLKKLYIQGRLPEAAEFAKNHWHALSKDSLALHLLSRIRQESLLQQNARTLTGIASSVTRVSDLVEKSHVESILRDPKYSDRHRLEKFGFSCTSPNDEDGILVEIFNRIGIKQKSFFEVGIENGLRNRTLYFLLAGWHGAWGGIGIDNSKSIQEKFQFYISNDILKLSNFSVTPTNVNDIAADLDVQDNVDLFSVDMPGIDYFVFENIEFRPRVVVLQYNGLFPPPHRICQAFDPDYVYDPATYTGASLQSLVDLTASRGYKLVATNLIGLSAFFVRDDLYSSDFFSTEDPSVLFNFHRRQLARSDNPRSLSSIAISPLNGGSGTLF